MPPACLKQVFRIVALDRSGNHSRSKQSRSNVPPRYASARRFFTRRSAELGRSLASEIILTSLQTDFFNNPLVRNYTVSYRPFENLRAVSLSNRSMVQTALKGYLKLVPYDLISTEE